jgi:16S rRNA (cytosine967-C5)-methyltransferase
MSISKARTIAFDVLLRVAKQNAYADDALRAELDESVKTEDAGLATELVLGVLRWQRLLDFLIDRHLSKSKKTLDAEVRIALRMGAYQIAFLDRIPARAAVHESVELVKRARKSSAATLVNAILRKAAAEPLHGDLLLDRVGASFPPDSPIADRLGIQYSHPTWLVDRWLQTYGEGRTRSLLHSNNRAPILSAYLLDTKRSDEATRSLQSVGCQIQPGRLLRDAWVLEGGNPGACEAVRQGWVAIQDEASQAVAHLVAVDPGDRVLDLCAAPGGKTIILARAAGPEARVIAADLHEHRMRAMRERFDQAGVRNVETITLDAMQALPFEGTFDRILVDVPCSGNLHERQLRLLQNALPHLAPNGRLVYSTCSLEPEENEFVVREALAALGDTFEVVDPRGGIEGFLQESVQAGSVVCADGFFRTFPPQHGADGFFGAVIERRKSTA